MATAAAASTDEQATAAKLSELIAAANLQYSLANYDNAATIYSEAAELQAELNGEMDPANADILFLYGRCLFKIAIANSDVLGGKVAAEEKPAKRQKKGRGDGDELKAKAEDLLPGAEERLAEEVVEAAVEEKDGANEPSVESKPYFQIVGDENWDTESDEGDDVDEEDGDGEEPEDDLGLAYQTLDMARVLLARQLEALQNTVRDTSDKGKGKAPVKDLDPEERKILERLADIHDLQAEIGLENENFYDAVTDSRDSLDLKEKLYPMESSIMAEAYFKMSLALEFASMTKVREAQAAAEASGGKVKAEDAKVDEDMREEAVKYLEKAIESCQLRVIREDAQIPSLSAVKAEESKNQISEVKNMIEEMETRLSDLRAPAVILSQPSNPPGAPDPSNPLTGILGELLGQAPEKEREEQQKKIEGASDISGLVKRKKPAATPGVNATGSGVASAPANGSAGAKKVEGGRDASAATSATPKRKSEAPEGEAVKEKKVKVADA